MVEGNRQPPSQVTSHSVHHPLYPTLPFAFPCTRPYFPFQVVLLQRLARRWPASISQADRPSPSLFAHRTAERSTAQHSTATTAQAQRSRRSCWLTLLLARYESSATPATRSGSIAHIFPRLGFPCVVFLAVDSLSVSVSRSLLDLCALFPCQHCSAALAVLDRTTLESTLSSTHRPLLASRPARSSLLFRRASDTLAPVDRPHFCRPTSIDRLPRPTDLTAPSQERAAKNGTRSLAIPIHPRQSQLGLVVEACIRFGL